MKNTLAYMFFACLLLACQDKGEALRQKRLAEMVARAEKALDINAEDGIHFLQHGVRKAGNGSEGLKFLALTTEIREKTKQILAKLKQEPNADIADYQAYLWDKVKDVSEASDKDRFCLNPTYHRKHNVLSLYVLESEAYCLKKLGAHSSSWLCNFHYPLTVFWAKGQVFENEIYEAKMHIYNPVLNHAVDSLWVNGVLQTSALPTISLPNLRAGKQDLTIKIKALGSEKSMDTTFSFLHTFHVLPRQK